jgi:hypothetical protein
MHCLLVTIALGSVVAHAQSTETLVGQVSDTSGGAISEQEVKAQNVATGLTHTAVTDSTGVYLIPSLPPGPYQVTVAAPGFKTLVQSGIQVQVGENTRVDVVLQIGTSTESVTVEAAAVGVDTQSSAVGATVDRRRLESLPLNGRNLLELAQLLPGVGAGSLQPVNTNARTGPVISVSGSRAGGNNILLDGTSMIQVMYNRGANYPNPDAVQEFRVLTNTFSAEYGRGYGGIFLGVTKSGTNEVHGSLFEFFRNDALNARNFFAQRIPKLRQNQFGGSLGGPVSAPGYDRRNRTFFGSYQGMRIRPESGLSTFFPATEAERRGDFSASSRAIVDPGNGQPFPNNVIPASRVDSSFAAAYLNEFLPLPNRPDGSHVEFRSLPTTGNQFVIKGDHHFSSSDRMSLRWFRIRDEANNQGGSNSLRLAGFQGTTIHTGAFNETHIFRPGLLNDVNVSIFRIGDSSGVSPDNRDAESFGLNVLRGGTLPMAPRTVVTGRFTVSPQTLFAEPEQTWQFTDKLSWIRSRHSIATGFEFRSIRQSRACRTGRAPGISTALSPGTRWLT